MKSSCLILHCTVRVVDGHDTERPWTVHYIPARGDDCCTWTQGC